MIRLSLLVGDHVKDANQNSKRSDRPESLRLFLDAVETITHDHFQQKDWTVDPKAPKAHPGLAACLSWSNDGVLKAIERHKDADDALSYPHCLYLSALRNVLIHTRLSNGQPRSLSVTRQIVMVSPLFNWNELYRKLEEHQHVKAYLNLAGETV